MSSLNENNPAHMILWFKKDFLKKGRWKNKEKHNDDKGKNI